MPGNARIPTSLVGSYAQPSWLIDREQLRERFPPRVRATELWRVDPGYLEEAQDDATRLAIADQERAGLDIVTDGEMRRESYSNRFATALEGVDIDNPGTALDRSGHPNPVPRVVGPWRGAIRCRSATWSSCGRTRAARRRSRSRGRSRCPSRPRTTTTGRPDEVGMAYADAVRGEILDLLEAGADVVQVDEPYMQARPEAAREYGLDVLRRATDGIAGTTAVHICFGYAAIIHERPSGYSFLPELAATECDQVSIETAQSGLDARRPGLAVVEVDHPRRAGPLDRRGRDARDRGGAHPPRLPARRRRPAGRRPGLRHEVPRPGTPPTASSRRSSRALGSRSEPAGASEGFVSQAIGLPSGELRVLQPQEAAELPDAGAVEWAPIAPYWAVLWRSGVALAQSSTARRFAACASSSWVAGSRFRASPPRARAPTCSPPTHAPTRSSSSRATPARTACASRPRRPTGGARRAASAGAVRPRARGRRALRARERRPAPVAAAPPRAGGLARRSRAAGGGRVHGAGRPPVGRGRASAASSRSTGWISWVSISSSAVRLRGDQPRNRRKREVHAADSPGRHPDAADQDAWARLSEDEQNAVYAAYKAINETPGVTPGLGLQPARDGHHRAGGGRQDADHGRSVRRHQGGARRLPRVRGRRPRRRDRARRADPAAWMGGAVEVRPIERVDSDPRERTSSATSGAACSPA